MKAVSQERARTMCRTHGRVRHVQSLFVASALILLVHGHVVRTEGALADTYVTTFRGGAPGAYTFTFDDGAVGQWQYAVPTLKGYDMHGTFFLMGASVEAWYSTIGRIHVPEVLSMVAAGHEIGSHTYNHLSLITLDDAGIHSQMALNQDFFKQLGIDIVSMAYPYSTTDTRVQSIVGQYVEFARDVRYRLLPGVW